jgi:hypothetical protein
MLHFTTSKRKWVAPGVLMMFAPPQTPTFLSPAAARASSSAASIPSVTKV